MWGTRFPDADSVHLLEWPEVDAGWVNEFLGQKWTVIRSVRTELTGFIEPLRREKIIGSSLQANVTVSIGWQDDRYNITQLDFAEIAIVSEARLTLTDQNIIADGPTPWVHANVEVTTNHKCGRCWRHLPEVTEDGALCGRCDTVLSA